MKARAKNLEPLALLVLDALPQSVLLADKDGRIVMRNAFSRRLLQHGDTVADVLRQGSAPLLDWPRELELLQEAGGGLQHSNMTIDGPGGAQLSVDIQLAMLQAGGNLKHVVILVADVSARLSMEKRLMASERLAAVGELAAKVAHELNNPLDGVLRYIGLAQRSDSPAASEHLDKARDGLMRMAKIVQGLLEQGHPRQGRFSAPLEKLLHEAVGAMQPRAQAQGVAIMLDLRDSAACAEGSLFQVFCNIIKNALDAMPAGGLLSIRQRTKGREASIEFADNGCGIDPADAHKIFEPFYTTKPPGKGSGLGLAISSQIVTRLGGRIAAAPGPERGTVVSLHVPLQGGTQGGAVMAASVPGKQRRPPSAPGDRPERTKP